jgi:hypothetical protein
VPSMELYRYDAEPHSVAVAGAAEAQQHVRMITWTISIFDTPILFLHSAGYL